VIAMPAGGSQPAVRVAATIDAVNVIEDADGDSEVEESAQCLICMEKMNLRDMAVAACGHLCCMECWTHWLEQRTECPKCRAFVRKKALVRLRPN